MSHDAEPPAPDSTPTQRRPDAPDSAVSPLAPKAALETTPDAPGTPETTAPLPPAPVPALTPAVDAAAAHPEPGDQVVSRIGVAVDGRLGAWLVAVQGTLHDTRAGRTRRVGSRRAAPSASSGGPRRASRRPFHLVRLALHGAVLVNLLLGLLLAPQAEDYLLRGVTLGAGDAPLPYTDGNPMAINTFLNEEPDPAVVEQSLDMIAAAGIGSIRQIFGWYEIEPQRGVYVDANGQSTWTKYDRIVDLATARGIQIIARLEKPPPWAKAGQPQPEIDGPPDSNADYAAFVAQVVGRYRDQITFVQLWNEPNLEGEWGNQPIDPAAYVDLLQAGAEAARAANPDVVILLAGLAPTDQTGPSNLSDLLFLQAVYDHGGAPWFDIAAVMVYGYGYSPSDRRVDFKRNNFSRPIQTREIMVRNGDGGTPVWAVEFGWVSLPDDWQGAPSPWGEPVSRETQARYVIDGYLRAQREWPWMGVMAVWAFRFPYAADHHSQDGNPTRGFALVEHDFGLSPAWWALYDQQVLLNRWGSGAHTFSSDQQAGFDRGWEQQVALLGRTAELQVRGSGTLRVIVDGGTPRDYPIDGTARLTLFDDLPDGPHDLTLHLVDGDIELDLLRVPYRAFATRLFAVGMPLLAFAVVGVLLSTVWMLAEQSLRRARHGSPFRPIISDRADASDAPADAPAADNAVVPEPATALGAHVGDAAPVARPRRFRRLRSRRVGTTADAGMDASTAEDGGTRADADDSEPPG